MKLKKLLKNLPIDHIKGSKEIEISGICSHSMLIKSGNLFIARAGKEKDGTNYIKDAIESGASAILTDLYNPEHKATQLIVQNPNQFEAPLSRIFYQAPCKELFTVGITGTNGKTTTSIMAHALLSYLGIHTGLIGTIDYIVGPNRYVPTHTTPPISVTQKLLREMIHHHCTACIMETTSHALDQGRCAELEYDLAVFTNLSQDHLDYHSTFENYLLAKKKLFSLLKKGGKALINKESDVFNQLLESIQGEVLSFGVSEGANYQAVNIEMSIQGTSFDLIHENTSYPVHSPYIGEHNLYNLLGAIAIAHQYGFSIQEILFFVPKLSPIPGRLELIEGDQGEIVIVDFAHSPDALETCLKTLKKIAPDKKIITLFGCGGDRDRGKRAQMGAIAEKYSTLTVITSDNPRKEPPLQIIDEICEGISKDAKLCIEPDRKEAIRLAIAQGDRHSIILIAGKGHEKEQIFAQHALPFDDCATARKILNR